MKTWWAFTQWELRLGLRSMRCKASLALYLTICCAPPVMIFLASRQISLGTTTFLNNLLDVQALATIILALALAGFRSNLAVWPEMRSVLASAPLSSAGYLLGRWLGLVTLLIPVTLIPVLVAAVLATASGSEWQNVEAWGWSWAVQIIPLALTSSALWLGLVTILGNELAALGIGFVATELPMRALNEILLHFRLVAEFSPTFESLHRVQIWWHWMSLTLLKRLREPGLAAEWMSSEAPFDLSAMVEWYLPRTWTGMALSGMILGLAVIYVRRTQRAIKPRVVPKDHPLRTYLLLWLRLRDHFIPAAAPGRKDLLAVACGMLILTSGFSHSFARQRHFQALASERYAATTGELFTPLAVVIRPESWKISGELQSSGSVALEVTTQLRFEAARDPQAGPQSQLAFSLNEQLLIESVEADGHRLTLKRAWDRVRLTLEPPLAAGESLDIRWRLSGTPGYVKLALNGYSSDSFVTMFDRFHQTKFARDLSNLSWSRRFPATSPRRLELEAFHLSPVPRYTTWALEWVETGSGTQPTIPEEIVRPEVNLEIDLEVPGNFFVADACGHRTQASSPHLAGSCRMPLTDYLIYGSSLAVAEYPGVTLAVLENHQSWAEDFSESIARTAALSHKAWPGMKGFGHLVVAEWAPGFKQERANNNWSWGLFSLRGQLLLINEYTFYQQLPMGKILVSDLLTRELIATREVDPDQELFFRNFYGALMLQRMGISKGDATMSGNPTLETALSTPLLTARQYSFSHWSTRLPALLTDLKSRIGAKALMDGVQKFLASSDTSWGTVQELFTFFEQESGVSLRRFQEDFIVGAAIPKLFLREVEVRQENDGARGNEFQVVGRIENTGTGEVLCPLLVRTEAETTRIMLRIDSTASTPFNVRTKERPFVVELDPNGTCHRLISMNRQAAERVGLQ